MTVAAVETRGLTKVFEKGRRTLWQRLRREPDRRERFHAIGAGTIMDPLLEHLALAATSALFVGLGLWAFRAADRHVTRSGMVAQH